MKIGHFLFALLVPLLFVIACADKPPAKEATNPSPEPKANSGSPDYIVSGTPFAERKLPPFRRLNYRELTLQEWDEHWRHIGDDFPLFLCIADDEDFQTFYDAIEYPKEKHIIANPTEVLEFEDGLIITHGRLVRGKLIFKLDETNHQITVNDYPLAVNSYYWRGVPSSMKSLFHSIYSKYREIAIGGMEFHQHNDAFVNKIGQLKKYVVENKSLDDETLIEYVKRELIAFDPSLTIDTQKAFECNYVRASKKFPEGFPPLRLSVGVCEHLKNANSELVKNENIKRFNQRQYFDLKRILNRYNKDYMSTKSFNDFTRIEKNLPSESQINDILEADLSIREKFYRFYQLLLPSYDYDSMGMSMIIKYLIEEKGM